MQGTRQAVAIADTAQLQLISVSAWTYDDLSAFSPHLSGSPKTLTSSVVPFSTLLSPEEKVVVIYSRQPAPGSRPNKLATAMTASLETYKCINIEGPAVFVCPHPGQDLSIPAMKAMHHVITDDLDIAVVNNRESGPLCGNTPAVIKSRFDMIVQNYRGQLKAREQGTFTELPEGAYDPWTYYGLTGEKMTVDMKFQNAIKQLYMAQSATRVAAGRPPLPPDGTYSDVKICRNCYTASEHVMRCSVCKAIYYCSRECQKADWKRHKEDCSPM